MLFESIQRVIHEFYRKLSYSKAKFWKAFSLFQSRHILSGIEVAEDEGAPLVEPKPVKVVKIDLSEYSVAENDGEPLVETSNEAVPEIAVPDFGLDELGAVLETIQEEKELLNHNTTGMTLAMAGTEMLETEEKDQELPPPAPDTSSIQLVPYFDV